MSDQDEFARILASLYQATLDDRHWPVTSALIAEVTRPIFCTNRSESSHRSLGL